MSLLDNSKSLEYIDHYCNDASYKKNLAKKNLVHFSRILDYLYAEARKKKSDKKNLGWNLRVRCKYAAALLPQLTKIGEGY